MKILQKITCQPGVGGWMYIIPALCTCYKRSRIQYVLQRREPCTSSGARMHALPYSVNLLVLTDGRLIFFLKSDIAFQELFRICNNVMCNKLEMLSSKNPLAKYCLFPPHCTLYALCYSL